ncbi:hypothetical protein BJX99DRAFT_261509 [Aspergillus californicus]
MTWATIALSHTALRLELFSTLAVRLMFYLVPSVLFYTFDVLAPSTAVFFKRLGEDGLPSGNKRHSPTQTEAKIAGHALVNLALSIGAQFALEYLLIKAPKMRPAVNVSIFVPTTWVLAKHLLFGLLAREFLTYVFHRFVLHSRHPTLALISNLHKAWYHSLRAPYPLTAHYDHPVPYLLGVFLPMYIPVFLLNFHMITFVVYIGLVSIEETFVFSGYVMIPWFPLGGVAKRMERHLSFSGKRYFGRWGVMDILAGTGEVGDSWENGGFGGFNRGAVKGRKE